MASSWKDTTGSQQPKRDSLGVVGQPAVRLVDPAATTAVAWPKPQDCSGKPPASIRDDRAARLDEITRLAERFANSSLDVEGYARRLCHLVDDTADIPLDVLRAAIRAGVKQWRFLPTAAEINEAARLVTADRADAGRTARMLDHANRTARRLALRYMPPPEVLEREAEERRKIIEECLGSLAPIPQPRRLADPVPMPTHSDASPGLKALAARMRGEAV